MEKKTTSTRTLATKFKIYPIRNAFTFAEELAKKHNWPSFVFGGKEYTLLAAVKSI